MNLREALAAPHSLEAERCVLGSLLLAPALYAEIEAQLRIDDFYLPAHREMWAAMSTVAGRGMPVDFVAVADEMKMRGSLQRLEGGEASLVALAQAVPTVENVAYYARIVREKAAARDLILLCDQIKSRTQQQQDPVPAVIDEAQQALLALAQHSNSSEVVTVASLLDEMVAIFEKRARDKITVTGVPTGITKLDNLLGGLQDGNLILIAARPGLGKTSMAVSIASRCGIEFKCPALFFSLEMMRMEIVERLFVQRSQVDSQALRRGFVDEKGWQRLHRAQRALHDAWIYIDDQAVTLREIRAKAIRWRAKHPAGKAIVVVDYLQLADAEGQRRGETRAEQVARISKGLKRLAKDLKVPIVALSQLSREIEKRGDEPKLSDLRESGSLEQDADVIVFPWRNTADEEWPGNIDEMIVGKNRNGPTGRFKVLWIKEHMLFGNLADEDDEEGGPPAPPPSAEPPQGDRRLPPEKE